jgi:penicillin amidase
MREAAERTSGAFEESAPAAIQAAMHAYLDGVNAFIAEDDLPFEYRLINAEPEPFTVRDVYCATGFMAYSFAIHLKTEPILDWMKNSLDPAYLVDLAWGQDGFTHIPTEGEPRDISGVSARVHELDAMRPVPQWLGSNAWVISGDRTASGQVVFCNDAHMAYASPSVWYEAHIVTPELEYYGNHIGGLPFPAIGHTRDHAWGITMFVNDEIDFYRETIDGDRYLHGGEWLPLETTTETIEVSGDEPVEFELRKTHHGPLLEDDLAMWWTFTQYPENRIHEAFYGFSRGEGIEAFAESASLVHAPGINVMYGDAKGDIGWWASAKLPMRPDHVDTKAAIDGTDPANDPAGWYGFDMNPQLVNPERGFVYSANNAPQPNDSVRYPGHFYAGNTRAAGIFAALSQPKDDWTVADAQALQLDHHSPVYRENAAALVAYADAAGAGVEGFMRSWDGSHLVDDVAPTLYYRWMYRTIQGAMFDEFERAADEGSAQEKFESWHKSIVSENSFPRLLARADSPWWDDVRTDAVEGAADIVVAALEAARADLKEALGDDANKWAYGRLHTVVHRHAMTDAPLVGDFLNVGPYALPAAKDALNKYEFKLKEEVNYDVFSGPSMRIGIDFADVAASESILPTGQSGNVFSPFYDNQAELYHAGQFRKQRMDRADIEAHQTAVAHIRPH